jgi:O-antigen/teichoic acid export membrane protein
MPYWTAFTEAHIKKDFYWIKKSINRLVIYWIISLLILILMFSVSGWIIKLWLGDSILIPISLSLSICAYVAVTNWNAIFANFLNGVGKIRVQILNAVIMGIFNIPICFILVKIFKMGTFSMPLSNFICLLFGSIINYIQYKKIVNEKATGVWNM